VFHVVTRGVAETRIYLDDRDRRAFLRLLVTALAKTELQCEAYCLMTTHYHVVLTGERDELSAAMHVLNGRYASRFNRRYRRRGHLFGDRFSSWIVLTEEHLAATIAYVLANPVRAGLCAFPEDWRWAASRYDHPR
jgi:REP element-mobilizing transposase RayT